MFYGLSYAFLIAWLPVFYLVETLTGKPRGGPDISSDSSWIIFFFAVVFVPLVETLLNQTLVFVIGRYAKLKEGWIILLSAVAFASTHQYSPSYILSGFAMGLVFAYQYHLYRSNSGQAFWSVTIVHAMHNATSCLLFYLLD
jgi:membrane protease YdiL (CAAX protease family)